MESKNKPEKSIDICAVIRQPSYGILFSAHEKEAIVQHQKSKAMPSTEKIPFEQLPQTVLELKQEISGLKTLITGLIHNTAEDNTDQWMNIDQLRSYHPDRPARSTIYDWVCQNRIPVHKDGKKLRFLKSEIDQWLSGGKIKTREELEIEAYNHLKHKRK